MAEDLKHASEPERRDETQQHDPELWDWARTAGVSREELAAALERSRRPADRRL